MKLRLRMALLAFVLLILTARRSPAPIEEETPSPSPTSTTVTTQPGSPPAKQELARFAGTWTGKIKFAEMANEGEFTLMINPEATSLILKTPRFGESAHPTTVNGGTVWWKAGPRDGNLWTLTPNPDGQTALVKVKPATGAEGSATFQRGESSMKRVHGGGRFKNRQ
jgi:hypothetical protein